MVKAIQKIMLLMSMVFFFSCEPTPKDPVRIAINAWPGYEFLYLAETQGFFEQVGLNIELVQIESLSDGLRAYINGNVDGLASTLVETVQGMALSGQPLKVVLISDYSNGADVIISHQNYDSLADLKGKRIGCEVGGLGIYVLSRALANYGLTINDVDVINMEQVDGKEALRSKTIDAYVTYPPVSVSLLRDPQYKAVFISSEIPNEILDTVSVSQKILDDNPDFAKQFRQAWELALNYYEKNKKKAIHIMSTREGISPQEFSDVLKDLKILSHEEQTTLFENQKILQEISLSVCQTLVSTKSLNINCYGLPNIFYGE